MFGVVHDVGRQRVEGKEVSYNLFLLVVDYLLMADHVGVYDIFPREEIVLHFLVGEVELHHKLAETFVEQLGHVENILFVHRTQIRDRRLFWQSVEFLDHGHGLVGSQSRETHLD